MYELQVAWFLLIGVLLIGYAILDGFDLGVGMLHLFVAKNDRERRLLLNSIAPFWDGNEVWLLTGGGAIFAAFPRVYATVFSGFYLALMLVLAALILRAVALEFRSKEENAAWRGAWDVAFAVGSFLPSLLFGIAIGNILRGVPLTSDREFGGSFLGLLNPFALVVGLLSTAMFVMQGAAWLEARMEGRLQQRAQDVAYGAWATFAVLWAFATLLSRRAAPHLWTNYASAIAWACPALFIAGAAAVPFALRRGHGAWAFAASSTAIAGLLATMGAALFPLLVPSLGDIAGSLTITNASSTKLTLKVMLTIALIGMPFVVGYTIFIYRRFAGRIVIDEHSY